MIKTYFYKQLFSSLVAFLILSWGGGGAYAEDEPAIEPSEDLHVYAGLSGLVGNTFTFNEDSLVYYLPSLETIRIDKGYTLIIDNIELNCVCLQEINNAGKVIFKKDSAFDLSGNNDLSNFISTGDIIFEDGSTIIMPHNDLDDSKKVQDGQFQLSMSEGSVIQTRRMYDIKVENKIISVEKKEKYDLEEITDDTGITFSKDSSTNIVAEKYNLFYFNEMSKYNKSDYTLILNENISSVGQGSYDEFNLKVPSGVEFIFDKELYFEHTIYGDVIIEDGGRIIVDEAILNFSNKADFSKSYGKIEFRPGSFLYLSENPPRKNPKDLVFDLQGTEEKSVYLQVGERNTYRVLNEGRIIPDILPYTMAYKFEGDLINIEYRSNYNLHDIANDHELNAPGNYYVLTYPETIDSPIDPINFDIRIGFTGIVVYTGQTLIVNGDIIGSKGSIVLHPKANLIVNGTIDVANFGCAGKNKITGKGRIIVGKRLDMPTSTPIQIPFRTKPCCRMDMQSKNRISPYEYGYEEYKQ